uniref:Uncharacterized protein n=1 Tax=Glossina austeni TaxID=7395 RepID=A0A1A9VE87_GLOAU
MKESKQLYDLSMCKKLADRKATVINIGELEAPKWHLESVELLLIVSYAENSEKKGLINSDKAIRTYELFAAITNFASIFHSGKISTVNWQAQQAVLEEIVEFLTSADLQTDTLATDTVETINALKKLMGELLEAYPDIIIQGYRLSPDVLERFFCRIAPSSRKRTRSAWHILALIRRLMAAQTELWDNGGHIDDYHAINNLNCTIEDPAEEFVPYSLDGVPFKNVASGIITKEEEEYVTLLTGYCIAQQYSIFDESRHLDLQRFKQVNKIIYPGSLWYQRHHRRQRVGLFKMHPRARVSGRTCWRCLRKESRVMSSVVSHLPVKRFANITSTYAVNSNSQSLFATQQEPLDLSNKAARNSDRNKEKLIINNEQEQSRNSGTASNFMLRPEIVKILTFLVTGMSKYIQSYMERILPVIWQLLTQIADTYVKVIVNQTEKSAFPVTYVCYWCWQISSDYQKCPNRFNIYCDCEVPEEQIEDWQEDAEKLVDDEDDGGMELTVRVSGQNVLVFSTPTWHLMHAQPSNTSLICNNIKFNHFLYSTVPKKKLNVQVVQPRALILHLVLAERTGNFYSTNEAFRPIPIR